MRSPLRFVYRAILRLHPHTFRAEFGDEMLWIFDQESRHGRAITLLTDGIRSLVVQHAIRPRNPELAEGYYYEVNSAPPLFRFTQAGFIILTIALFFSLFFAPIVPKLTRIDYTAQKNWLFARIKIFSSYQPGKL